MRRLVILRPEPGASATLDRARAMGLDTLAMPLFEVEPVGWEIPEPGGFDGLLLTSANAVRQAGPGLERLRALPAYAVGETTAAAALEAGFAVAASGDGGVGRLLESLPARLRLLHLCGEHRTLAEASQKITPLPVYRSAELPMPADFERIEGQVAAVHSPRAGLRLAELAGSIDRSTVRIAAISAAAAAAAGPGWERCEAAAEPDEAALLALATRLCDNRSEP